jgi:Na+/melibiose symporter-like transporter
MAECPVNSTLGVCDVLSETGNGIGVLVEALRLPLGKFIMFLAIISAVVALVLALVYTIKKVSTKHL